MDAKTGQELFASFIRLYRYDRVRFVREVFGVEPWPWQLEALQEADAHTDDNDGRMSVRSGHGVGKTTFEAWLMCHGLACLFPQKTVCTAPSSGQLFDALWPEFKTWLGRLPPLLVDLFDVKTERVELREKPEESFVSARTSRKEQPEAIAGVHCNDGWVQLIVDEASGVPDKVFESGAGSMAGPRVLTFLAGNPLHAEGFFHTTHTRLAGDGPSEWWVRKVATTDIATDFSLKYAADIEKRYGRDSNAYRVRVLGEFPVSEDNTIIPFDLVEAAVKRDVSPPVSTIPIIWGVDCARYGKDRSTIAKRRGHVMLGKIKWRAKLDTMELAGWIQQEYDTTPPSEKPAQINVDVLNMGAGVVDRLIQLGLPARGINASESPSLRNKEQYANLRTELLFKCRDWFAARHCKIEEQDEFIEEITRVQYKFRPQSGKIAAEDKDDTAGRLGRSPDLCDGWLLTFAVDEMTLLHGTKYGISNWKARIPRRVPTI